MDSPSLARLVSQTAMPGRGETQDVATKITALTTQAMRLALIEMK